MSKKSKSQISSAFNPIVTIAVVVFASAAVLLGLMNMLGIELRGTEFILCASALISVVAAPLVYAVSCALLRGGAKYDAQAAGQDVDAVNVTDPLTHIMNRRGITMGVLEAMAQAERYNTPLSVAMVDVDGFGRVNDRHGEATGDKVLVEFAAVLADTIRMPDKVGRYGGEEFMIVLPHTGLTQARKIADRIRQTIANAKLHANGTTLSLTVSIGLTQYTKGKDLEHLLSRANAAVEEAKREGGNRVMVQKKSVR